jgi:hypothetical protein
MNGVVGWGAEVRSCRPECELLIHFEHHGTSKAALRYSCAATREAHAIEGEDVCDRIRAKTIAQTERALLSTVSVEDYVNDALHLVELNRVQGVGHLDMGVVFPLDRDD